MADPVYMVWRENQRGGYSPELWFGDKTENMKPVIVAAKHRLGDDEVGLISAGRLTFAELKRRYPPPAVEENGK